MKPQNIIFLLFFLTPFLLFSQDDGDINLGGEDPLVKSVLDGNSSQILASLTWWNAALNVDSLKMAPTFSNYEHDCSVVWSNEVVAQPAATVPYNKLNVFVYLEDLSALQNYFLYRAYQLPETSSPSTSNNPPTRESAKPAPIATATIRQPATRPQRPTPSRPTPPRSTATPQQRTPTAPPRSTGKPRVSTSTSTRPTIANQSNVISTNTSAVVEPYPIIRKFKVLENGLGLNDKYLALQANAFPIDESFAGKVAQFQQLTKLYNLALADPAAAGCTPAATPGFYLEDSKAELDKQLKDYSIGVLTIVEEEVNRQMGNKALLSPRMQAVKMKQIVPNLEKMPIPLSSQRYLNTIAINLAVIATPLKRQYDELKLEYANSRNLLSPSEELFFQLVLAKSEQLIPPLAAVVSYAQAVANMPNHQTSYTQLAILGELLRICKEGTVGIFLSGSQETLDALKQVTQNYHAAVIVDSREFYKLGAAYRAKE